MKKILITMLFILSVCPAASPQQDQEWKVYKSTHFLIYYKNAEVSQLSQVALKAEQYYDNITEDLGFNRFNFWTWDNRARIYMYDTQKDYMRATGDPAWAAGQAEINSKRIQSFFSAKGFLENILPHEMAHIIFREMVGFNNPSIPLWLDEGVAVFQEKKSSSVRSELAGKMLKGNFISLADLSKTNVGNIRSSPNVDLFYMESFSLVNYLVSDYGKDKFVLFCQNLRDKKDLPRALAATYSFKDLQDFEDSWRKYLAR
jgi:hypothetical protein